MDVVAKNYHLYPELTGLTERVKEAVTNVTLRSSRNQSSPVGKKKIVYSSLLHTSPRKSTGKLVAKKIRKSRIL